MSDVLDELRDAIARLRVAPAVEDEAAGGGLVAAPHLATMRERWDVAAAPVRYRRLPRWLGTLVARAVRALTLPYLCEQSAYNAASAAMTSTLAAELAAAARRRSFEMSARAPATAGEAGCSSIDDAGRPAPTSPTGSMAPSRLPVDAWRFTEAFRGSEETVRARLRGYVDLFAGCREVVDLACGRGEFLALLRDAGVRAYGVDLDRTMLDACRSKDLEVVRGDAVEHLRTLDEASIGGVFSAQLVEHLEPARVWELVHLCRRVVRPGGVVVLEALNPESLLVLYRWFPLDPTHVWLVHPSTLRFFCEHAGLTRVEVRFTAPPSGPLRLPALSTRAGAAEADAFDRATAYLNDLLYGSYEYAVIARTPS